MSFTTVDRYYTGAKVAPVLTIVIGGNHEASNYMWELCVSHLFLVFLMGLPFVGSMAVGLPRAYSSWAMLVVSR